MLFRSPEFVDEIYPATGEIKRVSGYGFNSKRIVAGYRADNPLIASKDRGIWARLDSMFKQSIGSDFVMHLPSGRKMTYSRVRAETRIEPDKETGKPTRRTLFTADIGGKRVITYGGKLTENITQAVARDVLTWQIVNMEARGWRVLFTVHDEAVLEVDDSVSVEDVRAEMSRTPEWLAGCPVSCEAKEVPHYKK